MKKILLTLTCCALLLGIYHQTTAGTAISQIENCPHSTILFHGKYPYIMECANCTNPGGTWCPTSKIECILPPKATPACVEAQGKSECAKCHRHNQTWYPTAQTCSSAPCIGKSQECWYKVCLDKEDGLQNVDITNKTDTEKDIINKQKCCEAKQGTWYPTAQTCSLTTCENRDRACWYNVRIDTMPKQTLDPIEYQKQSCIAECGDWHDDTKSCTF